VAPFNIRAHADGVLTPMFEAIGFKRRKRGIYTLDLGGDFLGWLGLPDAVRSGEIAIDAVVGVRHQGVQSLLDKLTGSPSHAYLPPTVATSLGFLLPDRKWREWYFDCTDTVEEFEKFVAVIGAVALPFMRRNADLVALEETLRDPQCTISIVDYYERLPIVRYLQGDFEGATSLVRGFAVELAGENNSRADDFRLKLCPALVDLCKMGAGLG
jgi:hypothetical protein